MAIPDSPQGAQGHHPISMDLLVLRYCLPGTLGDGPFQPPANSPPISLAAGVEMVHPQGGSPEKLGIANGQWILSRACSSIG